MSRLDRLASAIKRDVATIIQQKVNDQRIGFISILGVEITPDLGLAKVFYSQIGSDLEKNQTRKGLNAARGFIKGELGRVLQIKVVPNLKFIYDDSLEKGVELVNKINRLSKQ